MGGSIKGFGGARLQVRPAPDPRQLMRANRIERAEARFLGTVCGDAEGELTVRVSASASHCMINLRVPGVAGSRPTGEGANFAYAWDHDQPWWQDLESSTRAALATASFAQRPA